MYGDFRMKQGYSALDTFDLLNDILNIDSNLHGLAYLQAISENIWKVFEFKYVFLGYAVEPEYTQIQTVVVLVNGQHVDNFIYSLSKTPCENVFTGKRVCIHPSNVIESFPDDLPLKEMEVQSYIGAPTIVDKKLFGLVALLDVQSISDPEYYTSLIDFIASRVSIELERYTNKCQVEKLTKLANTDPLTGLLNRAAFTKAVSDTLFDYQNLAVLFIDADFFKKINDLFGHQKGDDVLVMLGHIFIKCVREGDVVARYGGEEFVIYLPGANKSSAMSVANRIHAYLQKNEVHPLTVSIGVAISTSGEEIDKLLSKADSAVYEAKSKGRNQTVVFGE